MKTRLSWVLRNFPLLAASCGLCVSVFVTVVNVATRYCFRFTIPGYDEVIVIGFAYTVFIGAAVAYRRNLHFGIDLAVNCLSERWRWAVALFVRVLLTAVNGYLTWLSWVLMNRAWRKIMPASQIPYAWFDLSAVIGFGLMTWYSFVLLYEFLKAKKGKESFRNQAEGGGTEG